ncbi:MAG: MBL fold metallo-hydrolase [Chloroflexi bacterium]|nr:MAG: MBL fold metallo-hydrolase [Chloroflexota bacterium]
MNPTAPNALRLTLMQAGYTTAPQAMILRGGRWQRMKIPALLALIEHPRQGPVLFDTGYSPRFFSETRRWPASLYPKITPVTLAASETAAAQVQARGIAPADVRFIILSHFHADHVGGLFDFPNAQFIYPAAALAAVRGKSGFAALRAGYLPGLLPPDFLARGRALQPAEFTPLPAEYAPFERGVDIFGDGTLLGVSLPGHAVGQMGLFLRDENLGPVLLAADACWHSRACREFILPHPAVLRILPDSAAYQTTLRRLHHLHTRRPELHIIPSHCPEWAATLSR